MSNSCQADVPMKVKVWELVRLLRHVGRFRKGPMESVFRGYYDKKRKSSSESLSGPGSSLRQTTIIRQELPVLVRELNVRSLLDAPCGDCHWMSTLELELDSYIGVDIVRELIVENQAKFAGSNRSFIHLDIATADLPTVDLIVCRDCLVHLSTRNVHRALKNFQRSGSRYLLTTTFIDQEKNSDIVTGGWRPLNLQRAPFSLPAPLKLIIEGSTELDGKYADKALALWRLADIPV